MMHDNVRDPAVSSTQPAVSSTQPEDADDDMDEHGTEEFRLTQGLLDTKLFDNSERIVPNLRPHRATLLQGFLRPAGFSLCICAACVALWRAVHPGANLRVQGHVEMATSMFDSRSMPLCNASVPIPLVTGPRKANPGEWWSKPCEGMKRPKSAWIPVNGSGTRDWCWVWMKRDACLVPLPWNTSQTRVSGVVGVPVNHSFPALEDSNLCDRKENGAMLTNVSAEEKATAQKWILETMSIFVINMDKSVHRLQRIRARMAILGLWFSKVPGIDLSAGESALDMARSAGLVPDHWNYSIAKQKMFKVLTQGKRSRDKTAVKDSYGYGTIGCTLAHLNAMKEAESDAKAFGHELVLILEDDAVLMEDFAVKLWRMLQTEAPCDWEVISLRSLCPYGKCVGPHLSRVQPDGNEPDDNCRHGVNFGFFAMLYRASSLARVREELKTQIWNMSRPGCMYQDVALASISDRVAYYAVPQSQQPGFLQPGLGNSDRVSVNSHSDSMEGSLRMKRRRH